MERGVQGRASRHITVSGTNRPGADGVGSGPDNRGHHQRELKVGSRNWLRAEEAKKRRGREGVPRAGDDNLRVDAPAWRDMQLAPAETMTELIRWLVEGRVTRIRVYGQRDCPDAKELRACLIRLGVRYGMKVVGGGAEVPLGPWAQVVLMCCSARRLVFRPNSRCHRVLETRVLRGVPCALCLQDSVVEGPKEG